MYRLHNIGIEAKIDWLVKNDKLKNKKLIISPWSEETIRMYHYLNDRWGIVNEAAIIVDDEVSKINKSVMSIQEISNMALDDSYVVLFIAPPYSTFNDLLESRGVPYENIYNIKGDNLTSQDALIKCCEDTSINTVLDVGCGKGNHSRIFLEYGKQVTGIDAGFTCKIHDHYAFRFIQDDFINHSFEEQYDLVWCAHVLEHQLAVGSFINKLFSCCKSTGKVAITVPNALEGKVVEGHVNNFNAGLLMYDIIQSGYSCCRASLKTYAGNLSIIVPNDPIKRDCDYRAATDSRRYFPQNVKCGENGYGGICFDGNIEELNWDTIDYFK